MARTWEAGLRRATGQAQRSISSDEEEQASQEATITHASTVDPTTVASSPSSSSSTLTPRAASSSAPMEQAMSSLAIANKTHPTYSPVLLTLDKLDSIWGHIHKPTDLDNQTQWSRPLHWREKMAYMFWKFASQDSINELLGYFAKEDLVRPRKEVKMVMERLLVYDFVYDSGEESDDEEEEEEQDGNDWSEVDLVEILGEEEEEESDIGSGNGDDGMDIEDGALSEPSSLLAEALSAMQQMVNEDLEMMRVDTEKPSPQASSSSRDPEPPKPNEKSQTDVTPNSTPKLDAMELSNILNRDESLETSSREATQRKSPSSALKSKPRKSTGKTQKETTTNTTPIVNKPLSKDLPNRPKRKLQADTPQPPKRAKKPRTAVDLEKLTKELTETWLKEKAPIASEVKETRIALRIVGQRGTKSIKYKMQWADAGDCSFADSWVDDGDELVTREIARVWEAEKTQKEKSKVKGKT
ncbi:hypothetical protein BLS_004933 [Venturia inaequalis]|uniref:Uncharacterized protein n=1 Tax=Venturia inaequalis TaxID=5025 RepID=A0A8H3V8G9_VENIN|nr:hypothetical protein EG328_006130 [Venturia inaequalis]KAE9983098.1 hypothetical protein BLS_004933 [Venturia inaequalis]